MGCGVGVVGIGGTKGRKDRKIFFLIILNTTLATPYIYILQPALMVLELKEPSLSVPGLSWANSRHSNRVTNLQLQSLVRILPARLWSSLNDSDI